MAASTYASIWERAELDFNPRAALECWRGDPERGEMPVHNFHGQDQSVRAPALLLPHWAVVTEEWARRVYVVRHRASRVRLDTASPRKVALYLARAAELVWPDDQDARDAPEEAIVGLRRIVDHHETMVRLGRSSRLIRADGTPDLSAPEKWR